MFLVKQSITLQQKKIHFWENRILQMRSSMSVPIVSTMKVYNDLQNINKYYYFISNNNSLSASFINIICNTSLVLTKHNLCNWLMIDLQMCNLKSLSFEAGCQLLKTIQQKTLSKFNYTKLLVKMHQTSSEGHLATAFVTTITHTSGEGHLATEFVTTITHTSSEGHLATALVYHTHIQ